jgi:hypothetical protein
LLHLDNVRRIRKLVRAAGLLSLVVAAAVLAGGCVNRPRSTPSCHGTPAVQYQPFRPDEANAKCELFGCVDR